MNLSASFADTDLRPQCIGSESSTSSPPASPLSNEKSCVPLKKLHISIANSNATSTTFPASNLSYQRRPRNKRVTTPSAPKRPRPLSLPVTSNSFMSDSIVEYPAYIAGYWAPASPPLDSTDRIEAAPVNAVASPAKTSNRRSMPEGRSEFLELYEQTFEGLGSGGHGTVLTYR